MLLESIVVCLFMAMLQLSLQFHDILPKTEHFDFK